MAAALDKNTTRMSQRSVLEGRSAYPCLECHRRHHRRRQRPRQPTATQSTTDRLQSSTGQRGCSNDAESSLEATFRAPARRERAVADGDSAASESAPTTGPLPFSPAAHQEQGQNHHKIDKEETGMHLRWRILRPARRAQAPRGASGSAAAGALPAGRSQTGPVRVQAQAATEKKGQRRSSVDSEKRELTRHTSYDTQRSQLVGHAQAHTRKLRKQDQAMKLSYLVEQGQPAVHVLLELRGVPQRQQRLRQILVL